MNYCNQAQAAAAVLRCGFSWDFCWSAHHSRGNSHGGRSLLLQSFVSQCARTWRHRQFWNHSWIGSRDWKQYTSTTGSSSHSALTKSPRYVAAPTAVAPFPSSSFISFHVLFLWSDEEDDGLLWIFWWRRRRRRRRRWWVIANFLKKMMVGSRLWWWWCRSCTGIYHPLLCTHSAQAAIQRATQDRLWKLEEE